MNTHPYLRAYMAGIFAPSLVLMIALTIFVVVRLVLRVPIPIERVIIFPMALVPNAFGLWNMLYTWTRPHSRLTVGLHGALLPFLLVSLGAIGAAYGGLLTIGAQGVTWFQAITIPYALVAPGLVAVVAIYYLVWKYLIGFLNGVLDIS